MSGINKVIVLGRVGKDPEMKYMTNGEAVVNFSIATSETWKDKQGEKKEKTEWHNCVAYRKLAEIIGEYVKKGSLIYVEGKLQTSSWEKEGVKHYKTEINVNEMQMLGGKSEGSNEPKDEFQKEAGKQGMTGGKPSDNFDSDIPFN